MANSVSIVIATKGAKEAGDDVKHLGTEADSAAPKIDKAGNSAKDMGDKAEGSRGHLAGLGDSLKSVAGIAAGFVIGDGLTKLPGLFKGFIESAVEDEQSVARLNATLKTLSGNFDENKKKVDDAISAGQKLGFSDDDVRDSFDKLAIATGNTNEALNRQKVAMDLARGANIPLADASKLLGKVTDDNLQVLKRMGVTLPDVANETDVLRAVQEKFAGQSAAFADSTAGKWAIFKDRMSELGEAIGYKLLPIVTDLAGILLDKVAPALEETVDIASHFLGLGWDKISGPIDDIVIGLQLIAGGDLRHGLEAITFSFADLLYSLGASDSVVDAVTSAMKKLADVIADFLGFAWDKVQTGVGALKDLAGYLADLAKIEAPKVLQAIRDFADSDAGQRIAQQFATLKTNIQSIDTQSFANGWQSVKDKLQPAVDILQPLAEKLLVSLKGDLEDLGGAFKQLGDALAPLQPALKPLAEILGTALVIAIAALLIQFRLLADFLTATLVVTIIAVADTIKGLTKAFDFVSSAAQDWAPKIAGAFLDVYNRISGIVSAVTDRIGDIVSAAYNIGDGIISAFASIAQKIYDAAFAFGKKIYNGVKDGLGQLWPFSPSKDGIRIGEGLMQGIQVGAANLTDATIATVSNIGKQISGAMAAAVGQMIDLTGMPATGGASFAPGPGLGSPGVGSDWASILASGQQTFTGAAAEVYARTHAANQAAAAAAADATWGSAVASAGGHIDINTGLWVPDTVIPSGDSLSNPGWNTIGTSPNQQGWNTLPTSTGHLNPDGSWSGYGTSYADAAANAGVTINVNIDGKQVATVTNKQISVAMMARGAA